MVVLFVTMIGSTQMYENAVNNFDFSKIILAGDWALCNKTVEINFSSDHLLITNLEGAIVDLENMPSQTPKAGPSIFNDIPPKNLSCIWLLANNHLMDYGDDGLTSTIQNLKKNNQLHLGAGENKRSAEAPLLFTLNGIKIGLISRCETQFGIASQTNPGVAAFDAGIYQLIRELKKKCDIVIASIHAAAEMSPWPSPRRQDAWRALVDAGADVVHGHHSHVPQGWERYKDGYIFYGLGNFCVDPSIWTLYSNTLWSIVPKLYISKNGLEIKINTAIIEDLREKVVIRYANSNETVTHLKYIEICNQPLGNRDMLEALWQEVSLRMYRAYFAYWLRFEPNLNKNRVNLKQNIRNIYQRVRSTLKHPLTKTSENTTKKNQYLLWYHLFACDSHNDAISTALGVLSGTLINRRTEEIEKIVNVMMPGPL
jgi:hypothetical protein